MLVKVSLLVSIVKTRGSRDRFCVFWISADYDSASPTLSNLIKTRAWTYPQL